MKTRNPGYIPGDIWLISERSGFAIRRSEARREWTGLIVHKNEWESRQPQDFVRGREDRQAPTGLNRSESSDVFVEVDFSSTIKALDSGRLISDSGVYTTAVNGNSFTIDNVGILLSTGQDTVFTCNLSYIRFDLSTINANPEDISEVIFSLGVVLKQTAGSEFIVNLGIVNWSGDVVSAEWQTPAQLQSITLLASLNTSSVLNGNIATFTTQNLQAFANALQLDVEENNFQIPEFVIWSEEQENSSEPTGDEFVLFAGHTHPIEEWRPKLTINQSPKRNHFIPVSSFSGSPL